MELAELNLSLQAIGFRVVALLIMAGVHGGTVSGTAVLLGDRGPKFDGRMTIEPTSHIDLFGSIGLIIFGLGWVKPVDIDAREFRIGRIGIVVVILAGFFALLATAALCTALILPALTLLPHTAALTTAAFLRTASSLAIWFALLALVPVPPLTGSLLLGAVGIRVSRRVQGFLTAGLLVAVATGMVRQLLDPAHSMLAAAIFGA